MRTGWVFLFLACCAPRVSVLEASRGTGAGAATTASSSSGGGTSSGGTSSGGTGGGWASCSTPEGFAICGGPNHCGAGTSDCTACLWDPTLQEVSECSGGAMESWESKRCPAECPDGAVCVTLAKALSEKWFCAPFDLGVLYANNGAGTPGRLRYADLGLWTGDQLPQPETCPSFTGFQICGGHCGGCPGQEVCTGRSPLHPYGVCVGPSVLDTPATGPCACPTGERCFSFTVQPDAQSVATQNAFCLPQDMCQQLAAQLPGGGTCL
jgi:hypothetical protein